MSNRFRSGSNATSKGLSTLGWLLMIPIVIIALLMVTVGFYEGRKAYWDYRVREMCEKDGGVVVFEKLSVSAEQYDDLPRVEGSIAIGSAALSKPSNPAFSVDREIVLKEWDPRVIRWERMVKRRSDGKVVGEIISYSRIGADFPLSFGHPTSFSCPEYKKLYSDQARFFSVLGRSK